VYTFWTSAPSPRFLHIKSIAKQLEPPWACIRALATESNGQVGQVAFTAELILSERRASCPLQHDTLFRMFRNLRKGRQLKGTSHWNKEPKKK